jgi:hypothetical protein
MAAQTEIAPPVFAPSCSQCAIGGDETATVQPVAGIEATSSTGSPSPSLLPVLPHAACGAFAFHHPSQGTQCGRWAIRRWLDTDGNVPARAMLSCSLVAS